MADTQCGRSSHGPHGCGAGYVYDLRPSWQAWKYTKKMKCVATGHVKQNTVQSQSEQEGKRKKDKQQKLTNKPSKYGTV